MVATTDGQPISLDGRAGLVANVSAHDADQRNFSAFLDVITDANGRIRKRPGIGSAVGALAAAAVTAMYEFVLVNAGVVDYYIFRATAAASNNAIQYRKNGGAWTNTTLPYVPTVGGTWVFETIDKRCVAVNGIDATVVFDGLTNNWITFGVEGPLTPPGYVLTAPYSVGVNVNATQGNKHIIGIAPAVWTGMAGKRITINGVNYTISVITVNGNGVGIPPEADLTENFKETTAALPYFLYDGPCDWELAPTYAYSYYNPTTGHSSNIRHSSLPNDNSLKLAEQNQVGRKITIVNLAYDATAYLQGFTKILLYRTPKNGNIPRALNPAIVNIDNANAVGANSWFETAASFTDTAILDWRANLTALGKPPSGLKSIKFRMGRLCGVKDNRLYFSQHELEIVTQLGALGEGWPSNNNRLLRANQTRGLVVLGSGTGNELLVIQTGDGDFQMTGFDQSDIDVARLATKKDGSFQYGAIESNGQLLSLYTDRRIVGFPGEDDYGFAIKDKLDLIDLTNLPGARLHRFSGVLGDFLFLSCRKNSGSSTNDVTYVYNFKLSEVFGRPVWYEWRVGFTAFTTAHNASTGALELWASNNLGETFQLLQAGVWQDKGANFAPQFTSVILRPAGESLVSDFLTTQMYVSNASFPWTGEFLRNEEAAGGGFALTFTVVPFDDQVAQGRELEWTPSLGIRTRGKAFQFTVTFPSQNSDFWVEKQVLLFAPGQTAAAA